MTDYDVVWNDSYLVGVPDMDEQHKTLVAMINNLFELCKDGSAGTKSTFVGAFRRASEYAQTHLSAEEEYLAKIGYPSLDEQKKEHVAFMDEVWRQFEKFNKDNTAPPIELPRFLKKWLMNHIAVKDKLYGVFAATK